MARRSESGKQRRGAGWGLRAYAADIELGQRQDVGPAEFFVSRISNAGIDPGALVAQPPGCRAE
jgi:hypothetical protein